ncbi:MAG TPA: restriction endonuclease [Burkholderiales bacterium]
MHERSLFAVLLRSPWWASVLAALATAAVARFFVPTAYAVFAALPFLVIGAVVVWRGLREPSAGRVAKTLERLRALSSEEVAAEIEQAYRRQGYEVSRPAGAADLSLARDGRTTLVACKRWKATRTGIDPLRELEAAREARDARECVYFAAGEVSEAARAFAAEKGLRLLEGRDVARLLA